MPKKIIFMGTPEFSIPALNSLIESKKEIIAVYSQPPNKSHRGQTENPSAIEKFAKENSLNVRTPKNLESEPEFIFFKIAFSILLSIEFWINCETLNKVLLLAL